MHCFVCILSYSICTSCIPHKALSALNPILHLMEFPKTFLVLQRSTSCCPAMFTQLKLGSEWVGKLCKEFGTIWNWPLFRQFCGSVVSLVIILAFFGSFVSPESVIWNHFLVFYSAWLPKQSLFSPLSVVVTFEFIVNSDRQRTLFILLTTIPTRAVSYLWQWCT